MPTRISFILSLLLCLVISTGAFAYKFGEFPGKGNLAVWRQANAKLNKGLAYGRSRNFDEAIPVIQQAISDYPYDGKYAFSLGVCFEDRGKPGDLVKARDCYRQATELAPDVWETWNALARAQFQLRDFESAKTSFVRAIKVAPPERIPELKESLEITNRKTRSATLNKQ